jgi:hypothetical protein
VTLTFAAGSSKALVILTAGSFSEAYMSFAISGGTAVAASDATSLVRAGTTLEQASAMYLVTGLNAGSTTFTAQYRTTSGSTATFENRSITVIPLQ